MYTAQRRTVLALVALGVLSLSFLTSGTITQPVPDRDRFQPSPIPDRIVLTWSGDPAKSQSVTWRTSSAVKEALAQIAPALDGPQFPSVAATVRATSQPFPTDLGEAMVHSATFENLEPGSTYAYRVGDGANWSEWNQFRTAAASPKPVAFLYFGDAQNDILSMWSRVIRTGILQPVKLDFLIHAGDLVNNAENDAQWAGWFEAAGWVNRSIPIVPVPGNHEYLKVSDTERRLSAHWRPQFTLPENGPPGLEETCYYYDFQGLRLVALNSNEKQQEQAQWLDRILRENPARWTVLTFHHPIYSAARSRDNQELRELWKPVIERNRVDLVLQGHDHSYARSNLISGLNFRSPTGGTVYVVSVSGPKMYSLDANEWAQTQTAETQLFQIVRIDGDRLLYESRTASGRLQDAFELRKDASGVNRMIELPVEGAPARQAAD